MATGGIIELKMKKQYLIGRALLFLGSVCLSVLELTRYSSLDAFFKWGVIVYIAIMLICYYFLLADIYMIKVLDESILFRSLIRTHNVKCSEIDKIYHIKNHYISPRVLVASNAILVVFNGKRRYISENYDNYRTFEKYVLEKFNVIEAEKDPA